MTSHVRSGLAAMVLVLGAASVTLADEVTLKGGAKLRGTILSESEKAVVLKLDGGGKTTLQKKLIESIKRTEPKSDPQPKATPHKGPKKPSAGPASPFPPLATPRELTPDILFYDMRLKGTRLWIYRPKKAKGRLPLVLVAPAGTRLVHGVGLGKGDLPEHLPYVRAGFCVVSYSLAGAIPEKAKDAQFIGAIRAFLAAKGGLSNARVALEYALARLPVDRKRVYAAGHSSAGVIALQWAAFESRIKAVAAFAPCTDIPKRLTPKWLKTMEAAGAKGVFAFCRRMSPLVLAPRIKVPVFLLHAQDDRNVALADSIAFVQTLQKTNKRVAFIPLDSGGHYQAMIRDGIPRAIQWFKALP
jgi:dienelactone hydrolase